ncbi:hypothetical protein ACQEVB_23000 [Pseudonocardia sp. CA-107938]|uniref:hypothetical protein n=1 Tax=Pseudonocardia sp. CA-107938 TaxID=3240021 RepID=UPI003D8CB988
MTEQAAVTGDATGDPAAVAERIAAAIGQVPGVAALHAGTYGDIRTYLPSGRLTGVRVGKPEEPVEVALVLELGRPIPAVVADVRAAVAAVCGERPVDVTVADVTGTWDAS